MIDVLGDCTYCIHVICNAVPIDLCGISSDI